MQKLNLLCVSLLVFFNFHTRIALSAEIEIEDNYDLTCTHAQGKQVCSAIKMVENLVQPCVGTGCDFSQLIAQMNHATEIYIELLPQSASSQAGDLAKSASLALCETRFTGSQNLIARLIVSANRFLEAMLELQQIAKVNEPETCEFR